MLRICKAVIAAKGVHFDESKFRDVLVFLWFKLYYAKYKASEPHFNVAQEALYLA